MSISADDFKKLHQKDKERTIFFLCDKWRRKPDSFKKDLNEYSFVDWSTENEKNPLWLTLFFADRDPVFRDAVKWEMFDVFCEKHPDKQNANLPCLGGAKDLEKIGRLVPSMYMFPVKGFRVNSVEAEDNALFTPSLVEKDIVNTVELFSALDKKYNSTHLSACLARSLVDYIALGLVKSEKIKEWFYAQHSAEMYSFTLKSRIGLVEHFLLKDCLLTDPNKEEYLGVFWTCLQKRNEGGVLPTFLPYCQKLLDATSRPSGHIVPAKKEFLEKLMLLNSTSAWPWSKVHSEANPSARKKM